jgi:hypothetical protein
MSGTWEPTGEPYLAHRMEYWVDVSKQEYDALLRDPDRWQKVDEMRADRFGRWQVRPKSRLT